ncbi:hypothetical protein GCM10027419_05250 [Pandoraea terrae]
MRLAMREEIKKGATQIKLMASGGVTSPVDPIANTQYSEDEIRVAVAEAEAVNTYVMAHAYTPRAIARGALRRADHRARQSLRCRDGEADGRDRGVCGADTGDVRRAGQGRRIAGPAY